MIFAFMQIFGQDCIISFEGTGQSANVENVIVENLTQGTIAEVPGDETLELFFTVDVMNISADNGNLQIYPNPSKGNATVIFNTQYSGETKISVYDITGREINYLNSDLSEGMHKFVISGLRQGMYFIHASSSHYQYTKTIISQNNSFGKMQISYLESDIPRKEIHIKKYNKQKSVQMSYTPGDNLMFRASSGDYCTIVTDDPAESKTITFEFIECRDYDGNNYPVVNIGGQIWMGESLKTTHYMNGTPIPNITDNTEWAQQESGAYCWYNNEDANKDVYGALYNWYTVVNENNIAPVGWHVPTKNEIIELTDAPGGGYSHNGGKLKETGTEHWFEPNVGATNEFGFTALPGGYRSNTDGVFHEQGEVSYTSWSTTPDWNDNIAWYFAIDGINDRVYLYGYFRKCGFSIRCIKD